jgi:hypothetical protein
MAIYRLRFQFANWASPRPFSYPNDRDELLTAAEESLDLLAHWKLSLQIRIRGRDRQRIRRRGTISAARS